ncbi:hypothetical protein AVEN_259228-1 [Araneus ventricosus]|uniref:Tc1-like transposase DDE domain-containing protein n=1 Tax=Araneus ventricosus TaxID=182803 RepID=A0A4Y2V780_ARAVE|nr:hypothetical protein AVEN_259228-1 [Araneus ventricosus]
MKRNPAVTPQRLENGLARPMLQFASSDSSAESEISKAESMSRRNHFHDEMRWRAAGMLQAGERQSDVVRELNVHRSVIHRMWNHYLRDQNSSRRRGSGRRRITTTANDRYLLQCARRLRTATADVAALCCCRKNHIPPNCVAQTVVKEDCSHDDQLFLSLCPQRTSERGCIGPREHRSWTPEKWGHVLFMDESRFNIQIDSRMAMIWREPGTHYRAPNIVERNHYRGSRLLVWAGNTAERTAELTFKCSLGVPSQWSDIAT